VHQLLCRRRPDYEVRDYEPSAVAEAFREGQTEISPSGGYMAGYLLGAG